MRFKKQVQHAGLANSADGKSKRRKPREQPPVFQRYIKRMLQVMNQDHSKKTVDVLNVIALNLFSRISLSAAQLAKKRKRMTMLPSDIAIATRLIMSGEVGDCAALNIRRAIANYDRHIRVHQS